jgi:hypothetical protein
MSDAKLVSAEEIAVIAREHGYFDERIAALVNERWAKREAEVRALVEAVRAWLTRLEREGGGRYLDGVPGDLMDALDAMEGE